MHTRPYPLIYLQCIVKLRQHDAVVVSGWVLWSSLRQSRSADQRRPEHAVRLVRADHNCTEPQMFFHRRAAIPPQRTALRLHGIYTICRRAAVLTDRITSPARPSLCPSVPHRLLTRKSKQNRCESSPALE